MIGRHYLYRHIRLDKNEPFYIGVGTTTKKGVASDSSKYRRAFETHNRSRFWKTIAAKTDYEVEILLESDDYDFIKNKEIEFIALYRRIDCCGGILCNLTDGGDGTLGSIKSEESRLKSTGTNHVYHKSKNVKHPVKGIKHPLKRGIRQKEINDERGLSKKVIDLKDKTIYGSIKEAADKNGLKRSVLARFLHKTRFNPTTLVFLSDYLANDTQQGKTPRIKKVQDTSTGIIYNTIKEACDALGFKKSSISNYLNGIRPNKTALIYYIEPDFRNP